MATTNNWFLLTDEGSNTWASKQVEETSPYADSTEVVYQVYDFQTVYNDSVPIYYDIDSDIGQVTGGGTFPFAAVTSDANVEYSVLQTSATKDLAVAYSTRQEIDTQLYVLWTVLIGVEADSPEITYGVGGYVETDSVEMVYAVLAGVEADATEVSYNVVGEILADKTASYNMTSTPLTATNLLTPTWGILSTAEQDLSQNYTVLTGVEKDSAVTYYVFGETYKDLDSAYDIPGTVETSNTIVYNLFAYSTAESSLVATYQISSEIVIVPNVLGMPLSLATSTIQGTGLTVGTVTYVTLQ